MDPSAWMDPYAHLRVSSQFTNVPCHSQQQTSMTTNNSGRHHQMNSQTTTTMNNGNCQQQKSTTNVINKNNYKQHQQPYGQQTHQQNHHHPMNQYAANMTAANHAAAAAAQAGTHGVFMNNHYRPTNCSSWLFNSRQQHDNHDNSLHNMKNHHTEFNSSPFASLQHHHSVYADANFMQAAASFNHQTTTTKSSTNNYLSTVAAGSEFVVDQMKRTNDTNGMNYRNGSAYCSAPSKTLNDTCNNSLRDPSGFFSSHSLATNGWHHHPHHQNFMPTTNQHDQVNMINQNGQNIPSSTTMVSSRHHHHMNNSSTANNSCMSTNNSSSLCNKVQSTNLTKCQQTSTTHENNHHQMNQMNSNVCERYKNAPAPTAPASITPFSNNPYLMQNISMNAANNQNHSFVDPSLGAKFAANAHRDPYASLAFAAAAQAEYAAFQQQQNNINNQHKHSHQYVSSMNNHHHYTHHHHMAAAAAACQQTAEHYPGTVPGSTTNFKTNRHNNFMNYCPTSLFPMTHSTDVSMNAAAAAAAAFKTHNPFFEDYPSINDNSGQTLCKATTTKSRKSQKVNSKSSGHVATNNNVPSTQFNDFQTNPCSVVNNSMLTNGVNSCYLSNNNSNNNNGSSTPAPTNATHSRCSSVSSNSHQQLGPTTNTANNNGDSYNSYNSYPSPVTTNLSVHSPYQQQRSSTSNSSHSSINSCAMSNGGGGAGGAPEYLNYGTPNSAPPTVFQTMGSSQTPTPTPGYPTPPSSVGHSNSRCNSNEELSPFSNNSMSSNMSHQSYGRNDFNKSTSSTSSQISPKQVNDINLNDGLQFNSCMVAATQNGGNSNGSQQSSPNLYSSSNIMDNSYKSPQYYATNPIANSQNGPLSNDNSNEAAYGGKYPKDPIGSIGPDPDATIKLQVSNVDDNTSMSYEYNYPEPQDNSFNYTEKSELSSCSKTTETDHQTTQPVPPSTIGQQPTSSHLISELSENNNNKSDYHRPDLTDNDGVDDNFNLNFDSVIQPINVNLSEQDVQQRNDLSETNQSNAAIIQMTQNGPSSKTQFQTMDDLNFMTTQNSKQDDYVNQNHENNQPTTLAECDQLNYRSSQENADPMSMNVVDTTNSIESLIDSLPKAHDKNAETELLSTPTSNDNFLSDLAPLMNDNSKIALMESTFKSNQIATAVDGHHTNATNGFDKLHKTIFDDIHKINADNNNQYNTKPTTTTADDDDNQFRDVDEFLKSNYKELPQENDNNKMVTDAATTTIANVNDENHSIVSLPISISNSDKIENDVSIVNVDSVKETSPLVTNSKSDNVDKNIHKSTVKRKLKDVNDDDANGKKKRSRTSKSKTKVVPQESTIPVPETITQITNNVIVVAEYDFKDDINKRQQMIKLKQANKAKTSVQQSQLCQIGKSKQNKKLTNQEPSIKNIPVVNKNDIVPGLNKTTMGTKLSLVTSAPVSVPVNEPKSKKSKPWKINDNKKDMKKSLTTTKTTKPTNLVIKSKPEVPNSKKLSSKDVNKQATTKITSPSLVDVQNSKTTTTKSSSDLKENVNQESNKFSMITTSKSKMTDLNTTTTMLNKTNMIQMTNSGDISNDLKKSSKKSGQKTNSNNNKKDLPIKPKSIQPSNLSSSSTLTTLSTISTMAKNLEKKSTTSTKTLTISEQGKRNKLVPIVSTNNAKVPTPVSNGTGSSGPLLSPNLINAACLNKTATTAGPALTSVTPTLIVNQGHSVNPYQVSPMTNAVLISIPTPIPSLTAQSTFITLNPQGVQQTSSTSAGQAATGQAGSGASNTSTTTPTTPGGGGSSQNSSRRRSQDKKASTIREGLMRTGDFVVAEEEAHLNLPVIWRIEGKSLLQRFEPSEQNGITVYINTSSYSAWNPTVRQKYLGLDVRIMGCNRTRIVVEKIGLTQQNKNDIRDNPSLNEKENNSSPTVSSPTIIMDYFENFEVFIQTLISQALDSNFIPEIIKDNDEYFLSHMQIIEDVCNKRRLRFIGKFKWENSILKNFETYPNIQIHKQNNVGDLRCRSCHDNWSTKILYFEGEHYNRDTLEKIPKETDSSNNNKKAKIAACDSCMEKIFLYSKLYHHRYNFYQCCKSKVEEMRNKDPNKESHVILDESIQDNDWMKKMFHELETILYSCDSLS